MFHPRRTLLALSWSLGLAFGSIGPEARAGFDNGVVTYTVSTPSSTPTDLTQTLAVPAFDSTLGKLSSVTLSLSDGANILGSIYNKSASARNFSVSEDVVFNASFQGQGLTDDLNASNTYTGLASGSTAKFGMYSLTGNSGTTLIIDPSVLKDFIGTAPLNFNFNTLTNTVVGGGGGNAMTVFHTTADATLTITYGYIKPDVVPEPASIAMTALGGLMVAAAGYARNRTRAGRPS